MTKRTLQTVKTPTLATSTVPEIIKRTVEQAVRTLDATGAEYIIRLSDGTLISKGAMELAASSGKPKHTRSPLKMPRGSMARAVRPQVACLKVGDVAQIRLTPEMLEAGVNLRDLLSTVSNSAFVCFGKESHKVCMNRKDDCIEILRTI